LAFYALSLLFSVEEHSTNKVVAVENQRKCRTRLLLFLMALTGSWIWKCYNQ